VSTVQKPLQSVMTEPEIIRTLTQLLSQRFRSLCKLCSPLSPLLYQFAKVHGLFYLQKELTEMVTLCGPQLTDSCPKYFTSVEQHFRLSKPYVLMKQRTVIKSCINFTMCLSF
jgi:hypothetical protein